MRRYVRYRRPKKMSKSECDMFLALILLGPLLPIILLLYLFYGGKNDS